MESQQTGSGVHSNHETGWMHWAHYGHYAHLVAESVEGADHAALLAAQKLMRTHAQMAIDLCRMNRHVNGLKQVARLGGAPGETAALRLVRARELYGSMYLRFDAERKSVNEARNLLRYARSLPHGPGGKLAAKLGPAMLKFETALRGSQVGSKLLTTGRIVSSKAFTNGLLVLGAAVSAVESYRTSPAETTPGKLANGLLGGGAGALTMANPWVAGADMVLPKGFKPGEHFRGTADAVTAIGEEFTANSDAMINFQKRSMNGEYGKVMQETSGFGQFVSDMVPGVDAILREKDSKPLDAVHKRSMDGAYGKVLQAASEAGEFWSKAGFEGGMREFGEAVKWWVSH